MLKGTKNAKSKRVGLHADESIFLTCEPVTLVQSPREVHTRDSSSSLVGTGVDGASSGVLAPIAFTFKLMMMPAQVQFSLYVITKWPGHPMRATGPPV